MELNELRSLLHQTNLGIMNSPRLKDDEKGTMMLNEVSVLGILKHQKRQKMRKSRRGKVRVRVNVNEEFLNESIRDLELACEDCEKVSCEGCMMNPYLVLQGK